MLSLLANSLSFFIFVFIFILFLITRTKIDRRPPGPRKLPIIGNIHQIGELPHRTLKLLSDKYGQLMFLQLGSIPTLVVSSADSAREILKNNDLAFSGRPVLYAAKKLSYNCSNVSFAPYGEHWRELKKILILELLSAKMVRSFEAIRREEVGNTVDRIANFSMTSDNNNVVNLSELILLLANKVVCRVAFGKIRDENMEGKFLDILFETQTLLGTSSISDFFPKLEWVNKFNGLEKRLENNFKQLDSFYDEVIEEHLVNSSSSRAEQDQEDVVDVLVRLQRDPNQAITLKNQHIKGVLADIFIAGSDTSAATVIWTMSELIKNPTCMEKAKKEIQEVMNGKPNIEESDLPKLKYLNMVIKEALRMHPPVPLLVPRETIQNCTIQGYKIPAKTRVFINATAISVDPKYWKNPYEFRPERFLERSVDYRGKHFEFIPFGGGRRGCPGINFSISMIEHALANLLYHFDWKLPQGMQADELDMEEAVGLTTHKKVPLCLQASPRFT